MGVAPRIVNNLNYYGFSAWKNYPFSRGTKDSWKRVLNIIWKVLDIYVRFLAIIAQVEIEAFKFYYTHFKGTYVRLLSFPSQILSFL